MNSQYLGAFFALCFLFGIAAVPILIIWHGFVWPVIQKFRRGLLLEKLRYESIEYVIKAAEEWGFFPYYGPLDIPWRARNLYPASALGEFVASLLHNRERDDDYNKVIRFLTDRSYCSRRYARNFVAAMHRHQDVQKRVLEAIDQVNCRKHNAEKEKRREQFIEKGATLICGKKKPQKGADVNEAIASIE